MNIMNLIKSQFSAKILLGNKKALGELPNDKEIAKKYFNIAWPSAFESIMVSLIAAVDMMMVGSLGKEAVSSIGITSQPKFLLLATILSMNIGVTVLVARRKGENDSLKANNILRQAIIISVILSFILMSLGSIFARELLSFAGAGVDFIDLAVEYFQIVLVGTFFYAISLTITSAQRGVGNTKISMITNLSANLINFILNFILIYGHFGFPALGVKGAAIATAIGNFFAFVIALYSVSKKSEFLKLEFKKSKFFDKNIILEIYRIAKPTFYEQIVLRIGFFTYAKSVAGLGTIAFSAHQVTMNVMQISFAFGDGLQVATTSLVGQNLGANRSDLSVIYSKFAQKTGYIVGIMLSVFIYIFRKEILYLFIQDAEVIQAALLPITILTVTLIFQIVQVITIGSLRGGGDVKFVALVMLISVGIFRPLLSYILAYKFNIGLNGAWIAVFIDQIIRHILSRDRFLKGQWYSKKI